MSKLPIADCRLPIVIGWYRTSLHKSAIGRDDPPVYLRCGSTNSEAGVVANGYFRLPIADCRLSLAGIARVFTNRQLAETTPCLFALWVDKFGSESGSERVLSIADCRFPIVIAGIARVFTNRQWAIGNEI